MGQRLAVFVSPNIPRAPDCRPDFISPSGPLSRHRERGWGERADTPVATLGAILCAVRIDFRLPPKINPYPAQPATGVLGQRPKRVLVPFTRVKGTPRRRAVLTKFSKRLAPPIGDIPLLPTGSRCAGAGLIFAEELSRRQAPANPTPPGPDRRKNIPSVKNGAVIFTFHIFHKVFHSAANYCIAACFRVKCR